MLMQHFSSRQLQIAVSKIPSSMAKPPSTKLKSNALDASPTESPLMLATLNQLEAARQFKHKYLDSLKTSIETDPDIEQRDQSLRKWRHCYEELVRLENNLEERHDKGMRIKRFHEMSTKEWISVNGPKHVLPFLSLS